MFNGCSYRRIYTYVFISLKVQMLFLLIAVFNPCVLYFFIRPVMHLEAFTFLLCSFLFLVQQNALKIRTELQTCADRKDLRDAKALFKQKLQYEMINSRTLSIKHVQRCLSELLCAFLKYGNIMKTGKDS